MDSVQMIVSTNNKTKIISMVDRFIGRGLIKKIDETLLEIKDSDFDFDEKFVLFLLSISMPYKKELKNWESLREMYFPE